MKNQRLSVINGEFFNEILVLEDCQISTDRVILRPTQSLAQKWLREVHKIQVHCNYENMWGEWICYYNTIPTSFSRKKVHRETYEQALEAGLLASLNYLKQNKKIL